MKKAISLLLTALMLCTATSALAATATTNTSRSGGLTLATANNVSMPCFRVGDTITFSLASLGAGSNKEITVISYKDGAEGSLSDSNVQYINQYTTSDTSQSFTYKIRNEASGVYVLKINDSVGTLATFYYKVGNATALVSNNGTSWSSSVSGTPYKLKQTTNGSGKWTVGFIGKVTLDNGSVSLTDINAHPGFVITGGGKTKKYGFGYSDNSSKTVAALQSSSFEIAGAYSYIYGVNMYDVPNGSQNSFTVEATIDAAE